MKILHIVPGTNDVANGMVVVAKLLAKEQGDAEVVDLKRGIHANIVFDMTGRSISPERSERRRRLNAGCVSPLHEKGNVDFVQKRRDAASPSQCCICNYEEVWVHGMWLPKEWLACWRALRVGKRLVRMTHGSLSPLYLKCQSPFKKWLVGPIERWCLRRSSKIVATCEAEAEWIRAYEPRVKSIEVTDIKRFFNLNPVNPVNPVKKDLHLLYLGRRHPLKGLEYLETAVRQIKESSAHSAPSRLCVKYVSNAFGDELERVWNWCDVLVLPTLSENFGLVIAEALERGKRVITTDGAPAWNHEIHETHEKGVWSGYGGRLVYLKGYRDGTNETRVELLKKAIKRICE